MSLNFDSLALSEVAPGDIKGTSARRSAVLDTPVYAWFAETAQTGMGKSVTLHTAEQAEEFVRLVGLAAAELNTGRKVRTKANADGTVTVMFMSAPKRHRSPNKPKEVDAPIESADLDASMQAHPAGKARRK